MSRIPIRATDGTNQLRGTAKGLLSAGQLRVARRAWSNGLTQAEIAALIGVSVDTLRARLRDQLADLPKRCHGAVSARTGADPTEEEIYGRLVLLEQAAWSDEDRDRRWQGGRFKRSGGEA